MRKRNNSLFKFRYNEDGGMGGKWAISIVLLPIMVIGTSIGLVVYMQQFSQGACGCSLKITLISNNIVTNENGSVRPVGWSITVQAISGGTSDWSDIGFYLSDSNVNKIFKINKISDKTSDIAQNTLSPNWYIFSDEGASYVEQGIRIPLTDSNKGDLNYSEMATLEKVKVIIIDSHGDGKVSSGDSIIVFSDFDNDGSMEMGIDSYFMLFLSTGRKEREMGGAILT